MTSLEQRIEDAFRKEGIHELIVRVGRYSGADLRAISTVQAIAIHRDARGGPWSVEVKGGPVEAILGALRRVPEPTDKPEEDIFG